ncbi:MAG: response regulator [Candidatus Methylomirabilales bacterium]
MRATIDVLIMEDDPAIRLALAHALKNQGAEVRTCCSLESALEAIRGHSFHVILADLRMRGQECADGLELLKVVRKVSPDTRVIVMTAYGSDAVEAEVKEHGGTYWAKSRQLDELLGSVMTSSPRSP